jgi:hypothetical protein
MKRKLSAALAAAILTAFALGVVASPAAAHTTKKVGAYQVVIGWGSEPAYSGLLNSVQVVLTKLSDNKPVVNLGSSLSVTVLYGTQQLPLALTPTFDPDTGFGTPGDYRAWFFPTAPGDYTFHLKGKIGSQPIDESFKSGPTTFSTVEDPMNAQFPAKAPSNAQISQRLDTVLPRLTNSASTAPGSGGRTLGIVGIVVGTLGLIVGGVALVRARA